jgi:hypothetical protein
MNLLEITYDTTDGEITTFVKSWYSKEVTNSFDRSKIYCRVLRPDDDKYKEGINSADTVSKDNCFHFPELGEHEGGFYFADVENILPYFGWGCDYCFVKIPDDATIFKQNPNCHFGCNVWRSDKIILSKPKKVDVEGIKLLYKMGMKINEEGYCIEEFAATYTYLYTDQELASIMNLLQDLKNKESMIP